MGVKLRRSAEELAELARARETVSGLVDEWQATRLVLREIEAAEHPDITDTLGRVWVWKDKDLYVHDSMAWPVALVTRSNVGWPNPRLLDNPNYRFCDACSRAMHAALEGR